MKSLYTGNRWESAAFDSKIEEAHSHLDVLSRPPKSVPRGRYRAYLAPAAMGEFLGMVSRSGFSLRSRQAKQSSLHKMAEKGTRLHAGVNLTENTEEGVGPSFQEQGFIRPPKVSLIESGFLGDCLISPRSSKEWDVPTNGASDREVPQALELGPGNLPSTKILENLDRGLHIGDLWYVNYSDLISCRMTGLTRFATFWVEGGELQAPVNVVRFDETAYRDLGENLVDMTEEREFLPDSGTYRSRSSGSMKMPGALVEDFNVTM
ncbi:MAG: metallopeptidase TldD-related protein [Nitrospinota bacterium]